MIPRVPLGELCDIVVGRTPARANPAYWGPGEPWLSIADMNQGADIVTTREQITAAGAAGGKRVFPGTVLLSFKLSIGKVGIARVSLFTNEAIAALPIRDPARVDSGYLARALTVLDFAGRSNRAAMGAVLNKAKLQAIPILLPPIEEQRRIAAILDQADTIYTKRRQVLAHFDALARSTFHGMFEGHAPGAFLEGNLETALLDGLSNGLSPSNVGEIEADVLTLSAVTGGTYDPSVAKRANFQKAPTGKQVVRTDSFLISRGNGNPDLVGVGVVAQPDPTRTLIFPDTVIGGQIDRSRIEPPYLAAVFATHAVRQQMRAIARTTNGTFKVNQQGLGAITFPLPPLDLQRAFSERIQVIENQRAVVKCALAADVELFASLQSRAFRGEL